MGTALFLKVIMIPFHGRRVGTKIDFKAPFQSKALCYSVTLHHEKQQGKNASSVVLKFARTNCAEINSFDLHVTHESIYFKVGTSCVELHLGFLSHEIQVIFTPLKSRKI